MNTPFHPELERNGLDRFGWLLPLAGLCAGAALASRGWCWIALDADLRAPWWSAKTALGGLAGALAGGGLWAVWRLTLGATCRGGCVASKAPLALIAAALLLGAVDYGFGRPALQNPFWLSVRARLRPGTADYFIRELATWRLDVLNARDERPGLLVAGSSQLLHGLDLPELQRGLPERQVLRRSLAGLDPLKVCGALGYLTARPGDLLLLYVGEMDIGSNLALQSDWIRPLARGPGVLASRRALGPYAWTYRRQLVDLGMASVFESWRDRDYIRHGLQHVLGADAAAPGRSQLDAIQAQREGYAVAGPDHPFHEVHYRALDEAIRFMRARGGGVVVFEGQVNPSVHTPASIELAGRVRARLAAWSARGDFLYVPLAKQGLALGPSDWADGTHLSVSGRAKFTEMVTKVLRESE
ncbi:MAG TPA: hypothetical protein PKE12_00495 [Kiritimatiellia bacterium]|nr:hypothetical protein [Kiritimatiellia bacterium]